MSDALSGRGIERFVIGPQAGPEDIARFENKIRESLEKEKSYDRRAYELTLGDDEPSIILASEKWPEAPFGQTDASFTLLDSGSNQLLEVIFDAENELAVVSLADDAEEEIPYLIDLVMKYACDVDEREVLERLYRFSWQLDSADKDAIEQFDWTKAFRTVPVSHTADAIRVFVDELQTEHQEITAFQILTGTGNSLGVERHRYLRQKEGKKQDPFLSVSYEDMNQNLGYYYRHEQSGQCSVIAERSYPYLIDDEDVVVVQLDPDPPEPAVEEFAERLENADRLPLIYVQLLEAKVDEAIRTAA